MPWGLGLPSPPSRQEELHASPTSQQAFRFPQPDELGMQSRSWCFSWQCHSRLWSLQLL
jgi:hypothetical protein